ncbi:MAG: Fe-S cluster assembly protein SufD [Rhizobiaceae bacterium]
MTAHTPRILTDGETALFAAYDAAKPAGHEAARDAAIASLRELGLPTRRIEAFHYTDLRALLRGQYKIAERPSDEVAKTIGNGFPRLAEDASVMHFRDGHYFDWGDKLPEGVSVSTELPAPGNSADAVSQINTAFATSGASITIAADAQVEKIVGIAHAHTGAENTVAAMRTAIVAGPGSSSHLIDRAVGKDGVLYLHSSVVDITIKDKATLTYVLSIEEGDAAQRLAQLNVSIGEGATLNLFILNAGGKLVRQEINFDVVGENSNLNISGVNLVGGEAHIDVTSSITHHVPNTIAEETFRNVATGKGSGVFQGQINVRQAAQLTDARMACNTLLLSDDCSFSAKPELEIFADDVQCAHGATVTDLEESYMFYLMARGISETTARRMLIRAFVAEIVEELEDEMLVEALEKRIDIWMERHV